jgi:hypothetical protein
MLPQRASAVSFTVAGRQGVVFRGRPGRDLGSWNSHYPAVYQLGFSYFTSERDGADVVPSVLGRQRANLTDQHAYVHRLPRYDSNDNLVGKLHRIGGPVDVAGGWFDAGGGTGNASNTIQGDYNFWFLPQAEDRMDVRPGGHPGPTAYYMKHRPVFQAAPPGKPISPDLAGRMAADFALSTSWRPARTGRVPSTCCRSPGAFTRWPRPAMSGRS